MRTVVSALFGVALWFGILRPSFSAPCPPRTEWPTRGFPRAEALDRAAEIARLEDYVFRLTGEDDARMGLRTDAVVIIHKGRLLYERYARGYKATSRHFVWSVTKSITNAFAGIAVHRGLVQLDDSVCKHVATLPYPSCGITLRNLLEFSSGLAWKEVYENQSNQISSVLAMLYGEGRRDMMQFVASHPFRKEPGQLWLYSSGDSTFLMGVLDRAFRGSLPPSQWEDYDARILFDVLGMSSALFERDAAGTPIGSSFFYATPTDLAKFGFLYLNDGCWEGKRLLPEGWVASSVAISKPFLNQRMDWEEGDVQGWQFWLNRKVPGIQETLPWTGAPEDAYAARGHWGQSITVIPSRDVVVVRTADDREKGFDFGRFLSLALEVAR